MAEPIIKWVGGKRQLLPVIKKSMPKQFNTYIEPFFGGGAVFFDISPKRAIINDFNSQLVNLYKQLSNKRTMLQMLKVLSDIQAGYNALTTMEAKSKYYYDLRERFNVGIRNNEFSVYTASLFIFLNKNCYNGLYRINQAGQFNASHSKNKHTNLFDESNIVAVYNALKNSIIMNEDFSIPCSLAQKGDFVFIDSPYYDTFDIYQAGGFSKEDHIRLAEIFADLTKIGAYCMLTNSNTSFIKSLYKDYKIRVVDVKRLVNCNANNRAGKEVIITNY